MNDSDRDPNMAVTRQRLLELHLQAGNLAGVSRILDNTREPWPYGLWVLSRFHDVGSDNDLRDLPDGYRLAISGWRAYRRGQPSRAQSLFAKALETDCPDRAWVYLGLAKVYTHLAWWRSARNWCIPALRQAREDDDLILFSHALGAVGEILLRSGFPRRSFDAFELSCRVIQAGTDDIARRLNCLATPLSRCGEDGRVRSLLMSAYHLARERDHEGAQFSMARLQFHVLRRGGDDLVNNDVLSHGSTPCEVDSEASAYLEMGKAFALERQGRIEEAARAAANAIHAFDPLMPMEAYWARKLLQTLQNRDVEPLPDDWHGCTLLSAPESSSPFDDVWRSCDLIDEGPAPLHGVDDVGGLFEAARMFFV